MDSLNNSYNDLWKYSISQDTWQTLNNLPALGRRGGIGVNYMDQLFYTTGIDQTDQRLIETWKYSPFAELDQQDIESSKTLVKIFDLRGNEIEECSNTFMIYMYDDGSSEKMFRVE